MKLEKVEERRKSEAEDSDNNVVVQAVAICEGTLRQRTKTVPVRVGLL